MCRQCACVPIILYCTFITDACNYITITDACNYITITDKNYIVVVAFLSILYRINHPMVNISILLNYSVNSSLHKRLQYACNLNIMEEEQARSRGPAYIDTVDINVSAS